MDILRIDCGPGGLHAQGGGSWKARLDDWLDQRPAAARVTILVHGYRYLPGHRLHDPHGLIYSRKAPVGRPRVVSWPQHLGGHVVAFGWPARGSIWQASHEARIAGHALAALAGEVTRLGHPASFVAHSLGCRAVLTALSHLPASAGIRAILMTPAAFPFEAASALSGQQGVEVLNVTTRENLLFDWLFSTATGRPGRRTLAQGLLDAPAGWTDLAIDCPEARGRLSAHGWAIKPPQRRICHWSPYLRPGLFPIYRAFLAGHLTPARLAAILPEKANTGRRPLPALAKS